MPRHFDQELARLREKLLRMAGTIETMIASCIAAMRGGGRAALQQTFENEHLVNQLQRELSEMVVLLIAQHQPVADDLRLLISTLNITTDLERMGDQAVNTARKALDLAETAPTPLTARLEIMLETVQNMVIHSVNAFVTQDAAAAEQVIRSDDIVDRARDEVTRAVIERIGGEHAVEIVEALLAARNIERIANHATNVAEDVIYLVNGSDVRNQIATSSHEKPGSWRELRSIRSASPSATTE